jgi:glycosyltransferase involved in cell wall biosynthesis
MFALYRASDVFLSMSEHEGFGLPFIEAMMFDLPIVAYDCTAVPSTLEKAGVLFRDKNASLVSELIRTVTFDQSLKERIIAGQQKRLNRFKCFEREQFLLQKIKELAE